MAVPRALVRALVVGVGALVSCQSCSSAGGELTRGKPGASAPAVPTHDPARVPPPAIGATSLLFSGYEWRIRSSQGPLGPGPNVFHADNVNVDAAGRLHLRIAYRNGRWTCAEVGLERPLGYGTYRFDVETTHDLDPRAVLGLFTWDSSAPDHHYREIDVEISRWGRANNANAQFVVQPFARPGRIHRFELPRGRARHEFAWSAGAVSFETRLIDGPSVPVVVSRYTVDEGVPRAGRESPRINLWLVDGQPPTDGQEVSVIVSAVCVHSSGMILV